MKHCESVGFTKFPVFSGAIVNMMPIIMGDRASIPEGLRGYGDVIDSCGLSSHDVGKIGYLTVTESVTSTPGSQRRGGLHTESPGIESLRRLGYKGERSRWGEWGSGRFASQWGGGNWGRGEINQSAERVGGIYVASTVSGSARLFDAHVEESGAFGDCEHMRDKVGEGILVNENEIWWLTDRCPHESLPLEIGTKRQFFRLVTNAVSVWLTRDNTANPLGVLPDCEVLDISKFH